MKIKLLQDRIGVATVYTGYYTARGRTIYDFHAWIRKIENAVAENMRVVEFAKLFEEQCRNNFDQFGQLVMKGHFHDQIANSQPLFGFLVCGHDDGDPKAYEVIIRWNGGIDVSRRELAATEGILCHSVGRNTRIMEALSGSGDAYDNIAAWTSGSLGKFLKRGNLTTDETSGVCAGLIRLEAELCPEAVGPPFRVLSLVAGKPAEMRIYNSELCRSVACG
ncbi:MAG: hypothetical protein WBQ08_12150 [Candidatus Sulfotelmatobacter sp.]